MVLHVLPVTTLDPAQAELAEAWNEAFVVSTRATMGDDHDAWSMASRRAREASPNWDHRYVVALDGEDGGADAERVVGGAAISFPLRDNLHLGLLSIAVPPRHRRRGVGSALLAHLLDQAHDAGRTTLAAETAYPIDALDPGEAFARALGFELAQTNHRNDLDLTTPLPEQGFPTPGYVVETSTDGTREDWLGDRVVLQERMSTDAPVGDLEFEEEVWDVERLRGELEAVARSGRRVIESVARHEASGRLVAFTQLQVPIAEPELAYQQDTLVLREHRGHGLGLAVKAANLRALAEQVPPARTVRTWNAADNAPMVAVNGALGFRATAVQREWQLRLP